MLETGKTYKTRDGKKAQDVVVGTFGGITAFIVGDSERHGRRTYRNDGAHAYQNHNLDIVGLWIDVEIPVYAIGDKITVELTITGTLRDMVFADNGGGLRYGIMKSTIISHTPAPKPEEVPKVPKVGDMVVQNDCGFSLRRKVLWVNGGELLAQYKDDRPQAYKLAEVCLAS